MATQMRPTELCHLTCTTDAKQGQGFCCDSHCGDTSGEDLKTKGNSKKFSIWGNVHFKEAIRDKAYKMRKSGKLQVKQVWAKLSLP